jgi:hypothetical protein
MMSQELSCKTPQGEKQIAVRFFGGYDRGMGVQMCVKIVELLDLLNYPAHVEGMMDPEKTVGDVIKEWLANGFEEQSYNLDPKCFIKSRAINDFKASFDRLVRIIEQ